MLTARYDWRACLLALAGTAICCASPAANGSPQTDARTPNRLTGANPEIRMRLPARPTPSSLIVLRVTEIKNPALVPISLDTAFAPCAGSGKTWPPERLANLGVYPPDQAGSYSVPVAAALDRLRASGVADLKDVCLQVRIRQQQPREPAGSLDITLAADWRDDNK